MKNGRPRTLILFYILVAYIGFQFVWWSYLLTNLTAEVSFQKESELRARISDEQTLNKELESVSKKHKSRIAMIIGEGSVFLLLLSFGIYRVKRSFEKETQLARQQKNFMLSVTHELKTPLAAVKLNLQTIDKRELSKEQQKTLIDNCLKETDRLNQLIENVLLAARMDNAELQFLHEKIELNSFVHSQISGVFNDSRIVFNPTGTFEISADRLALASILNNLIENALKYSEKEITIQTEKKQNKIILSVADFGPGIPNEEKELIFKKFYRSGNEETRKTKGTGLGLYIVKNLSENNGVKINLKDNSPNGCIFELEFTV